MSAWARPTTADVGLRAFSSSPERLMIEAAKGMQAILLSSKGATDVDAAIRHTGEWNLSFEGEPDWERLLVSFLEEVLYRAEVEDIWLVDGLARLSPDSLQIAVTWIDASPIEREVEIKAVTRHELMFKEIGKGETLASHWTEVPSFEGPGWACDVVFDI